MINLSEIDSRVLMPIPAEQPILEVASAECIRLVESIMPYPVCHCRLGIFAAVIVDLGQQVIASSYGVNRPSYKLLDVCWPREDKPCIRELSKRAFGQGYDNCPSVHALESVCLTQFPHSESLLWVECGVRRQKDGSFSWVELRQEESYPCLQCLRRASRLGIETLAWVTPGKDTSYHKVNAHAAYLLAKHIPDELKSRWFDEYTNQDFE